MYNSDLPNRSELPSSKQLLKSTIIAIVVAAVLLVTVVLPAEYGIDPTGIGGLVGLKAMGDIKMQLDEEAHKAEDEAEKAAQEMKNAKASDPDAKKAVAATDGKKDDSLKSEEVNLTLRPGEGFEVKLQMLKGKKVEYEWTTEGGGLNHDTHGDGPDKEFQRYGKGRNIPKDKGEMVANFDGSHGWFWRNRQTGDVTVNLKVKGEFESIKKPDK